MSIHGINSSQMWSSFQPTGITRTDNASRDAGWGNGGVNHGHGHAWGVGHGHGRGFISKVMQTLNELGLTPSNQAANGASDQAANGVDSDGDNDGSRQGGGTQGVKQALGAFLYDLMQVLSQAGSGSQATAAVDSDGDNDGSAGAANTVSAANPSGTADAVNTDSTASTSGTADAVSTDSAASTAGTASVQSAYAQGGTTVSLQILTLSISSGGSTQNSLLDALKADFNNLLDALNGSGGGTDSTASSSGSTDTLLSFLQALDQNLTGQGNPGVYPPSPAGSIVSATA